MTKHKLGAVILAAGLSSRMEAFKPLLRIDGKALIEYAIDLFLDAGVVDVLSVVGHRAEELIPVIEASGARHVKNHRYRDGMFSSVQAGVENLSPQCAAFFLLPVDIPLVQTATIIQLSAAFEQNPASPVCSPMCGQRRGHPPLINRQLTEDIMSSGGQGGLRGVLKKYDEQAVCVPVDDPFIHIDVDTPEDLSRLKKCRSGGVQKTGIGRERG